LTVGTPDKGVQSVDVYLGPNNILSGLARTTKEAQDKAEALDRRQEVELKRIEMAMLKARFESEQENIQKAIDSEETLEAVLKRDRNDMGIIRKADLLIVPKPKGKAEKGNLE
jgi:hypothetical protein